MRDLNYQLKLMCKHSHEGSFETRVGRERQLSAIANQLHDLGFRQLKATSLKQKHVQALVNHWLAQHLSPRYHQEPHELPALVGGEDQQAGRGGRLQRLSMAFPIGSLCPTRARPRT